MTSAASSRAKKPQGSKPAIISQPVATATQWQGPLPPPDALEKFNTIVEHGAERVFRMVEIEQQQHIESERCPGFKYLGFKGREFDCQTRTSVRRRDFHHRNHCDYRLGRHRCALVCLCRTRRRAPHERRSRTHPAQVTFPPVEKTWHTG